MATTMVVPYIAVPCIAVWLPNWCRDLYGFHCWCPMLPFFAVWPWQRGWLASVPADAPLGGGCGMGYQRWATPRHCPHMGSSARWLGCGGHPLWGCKWLPVGHPRLGPTALAKATMVCTWGQMAGLFSWAQINLPLFAACACNWLPITTQHGWHLLIWPLAWGHS